jgi:hypothetical protein
MKPAKTILEELARHVQPPRGAAIEITERPGSPNWIADAPGMDSARATRFLEKVARLRNSDPKVDWNDVTESAGNSRRIARWLSEVEAR